MKEIFSNAFSIDSYWRGSIVCVHNPHCTTEYKKDWVKNVACLSNIFSQLVSVNTQNNKWGWGSSGYFDESISKPNKQL
jgi:hypothetical protein